MATVLRRQVIDLGRIFAQPAQVGLKSIMLFIPSQIDDVVCEGMILCEPALLYGVLPDALCCKGDGLRRFCRVALTEGWGSGFMQDAPEVVCALPLQKLPRLRLSWVRVARLGQLGKSMQAGKGQGVLGVEGEQCAQGRRGM